MFYNAVSKEGCDRKAKLYFFKKPATLVTSFILLFVRYLRTEIRVRG